MFNMSMRKSLFTNLMDLALTRSLATVCSVSLGAAVDGAALAWVWVGGLDSALRGVYGGPGAVFAPLIATAWI